MKIENYVNFYNQMESLDLPQLKWAKSWIKSSKDEDKEEKIFIMDLEIKRKEQQQNFIKGLKGGRV